MARLVLSSALAAACGDTVNVFEEPGLDPAGEDLELLQDGGGVRDSGDEPHDGGIGAVRDGGELAEAGHDLAPDCPLGTGAVHETVTTCAYQHAFCAEGFQTLTHVSIRGCDASGATGDPSVVVGPESVASAESGQSCATDFVAAEYTDEQCCIDMAVCLGVVNAGSACALDCANTPSQDGGEIFGCDQVAGELRGFKDPALLRGRPCNTRFICGSDSGGGRAGDLRDAEGSYNSYGHVLFCAAGKVQLLTLGPDPFSPALGL